MAPTFLTLPLEIRLQIYENLLLIPAYNTLLPVRAGDGVSPAILQACRQTHAEAQPTLYGRNQFQAHYSLLSGFPRLRAWYGPVREASVLCLVTRWHLRVRLDADPPWDAAKVEAAFQGCDELVLDVWQAMFRGADHAVLACFEGLRGVRRALIYGSTTGFEPYARWLERAMMTPRGVEVQPYVNEERLDEDGAGKNLVPVVEKWW